MPTCLFLFVSYNGLSFKLVITILFKRGYYDALWGCCAYYKKEEKAMIEYRVPPVDIWVCPLCELRITDRAYDHIDLTNDCRCRKVKFIDFNPVIKEVEDASEEDNDSWQ